VKGIRQGIDASGRALDKFLAFIFGKAGEFQLEPACTQGDEIQLVG